MIQAADIAKLKTVVEVAKVFNKTRLTIHNWINKGVPVAGRRVRLAAIRIGGRFMIADESVEEFIRETNPEAPKPAVSDAMHARQGAAALKRLNEILGDK